MGTHDLGSGFQGSSETELRRQSQHGVSVERRRGYWISLVEQPIVLQRSLEQPGVFPQTGNGVVQTSASQGVLLRCGDAFLADGDANVGHQVIDIRYQSLEIHNKARGREGLTPSISLRQGTSHRHYYLHLNSYEL